MDARTQKMQDKVAKLLRQAEDVTGTPEEAIFQAKAFELMAKYGLEMAQVTATKEGLDISEMPDAIRWDVPITGKYVAQQALLLSGIVHALHCKTVYHPGKDRYGRKTGDYTIYVFGVERHTERARFLWEILRPQMLRLVEEVRPEQDFTPGLKYDYNTHRYVEKSTSGQLRKYRQAWIAGFASVIIARVNEQESKALESADSGALVLYRDDKARAGKALHAAFPSTRAARKPRTRYNGAGFAHGQLDGQNAAMAHALAS